MAYELSLPFALEALRGHADRGVEEAREAWETRDGKSGQVNWLLHVKRHIYGAVAQGGIEAKAKVGRRPQPKDESIREALVTFCDPETDPKKWKWNWKHLLKECGYEEARALERYLDTNRDELEQGLGKRALQHIEVCARERRIIWVLSNHNQENWVIPMGPEWAEDWRRRSRAKNLEGVPRPSIRRSWMEMSSDRAIAEALSQDGFVPVTPYQVKQWRERMEQEPYEEFDGGPDEYRLKIINPPEYEEYKRRKEQDKE